MLPLVLPPNRPHHVYRGGGQIAAFRGLPFDDPFTPEDWIGSLTARIGDDSLGLSRTGDGQLLRDLVETDPEAFFGPDHLEKWGTSPALLLKLLDGDQRLPVHCHPSRDFARSHLASPNGKTEAWVVLGTRGDAGVRLGFSRDVGRDELRSWVRQQDVDAMLATTNHLPVHEGDVVLVPAGLPHSIDAGVFVAELQEPTDFSIFLEWTGFVPTEDEGHIGLGWEAALGCVERQAVGPTRLEELRSTWGAGRRLGTGRASILPVEADAYFRAELLRPDGGDVELDAAFSLVLVTKGSGVLVTSYGETVVQAGESVLIPWAAGEARLRGNVEAVRARPPA